MVNFVYITYQFFPYEKANNLQSIHTINTLAEKGFKIKLIYPNRDANFNNYDLRNIYNINKKVQIITTKHPLPFGKIKFFNKFFFLFSNFLWSIFTTFKFANNSSNNTVVYTRTHWVLLTAVIKKNFFIYECHKYSKTSKIIFRFIKNRKNILLVFSTQYLKQLFNLSGVAFENSLVLHSSYFEKNFEDDKNKKKNYHVVFVGNLLRFDKDRNLTFLTEAFNNEKLKNFSLTIVGGPNELISNLKNNFLYKNVHFTGKLSNLDSIKIMLNAEIGILLNTSKDSHSLYETSPLKFFEYIRSKLKVVAVDFPSHRALPFQENIFYFKENNTDSLISAIMKAQKTDFKYVNEIKDYSYEKRVENILKKLARLKGFEPLTY